MPSRTIEKAEVRNSAVVTPDQTLAVLNALPNAIAEFGLDKAHVCRFANPAFCRLIDKPADAVTGTSVTELFADDLFHDALSDILQALNLSNSEITIFPSPLSLNGKPYQLRTVRCKGSVLTVLLEASSTDIRFSSLEGQAGQLMKEAGQLPVSTAELQEEIATLYQRLRTMESRSDFDLVSGFPGRKTFLERAAAEFQRSTRYQHALSFAVIQIAGLEEYDTLYGATASDQSITALGQYIESTYRSGVDVAGRISDHQIAMLFPETALGGALNYIQRLRQTVAQSPLFINSSTLKLSLETSVEGVLENDHTILQALNRCLASLKTSS